jgi:hypothetical protein
MQQEGLSIPPPLLPGQEGRSCKEPWMPQFLWGPLGAWLQLPGCGGSFQLLMDRKIPLGLSFLCKGFLASVFWWNKIQFKGLLSNILGPRSNLDFRPFGILKYFHISHMSTWDILGLGLKSKRETHFGACTACTNSLKVILHNGFHVPALSLPPTTQAHMWILHLCSHVSGQKIRSFEDFLDFGYSH